MLDAAIAFAAVAHAGQTRKFTGDPYIVHPLQVMQLVRRVTEREDAAVAAVLHDVLEDTVVRASAIKRRFGQDVLDLVVELTEVPIEGNRAARKASERERLAAISPMGQTIKLADLIANTRSIVKYDPKFAKTYLAEKAALLEVLTGGDPRLHARATKTLNIGLEILSERSLSRSN